MRWSARIGWVDLATLSLMSKNDVEVIAGSDARIRRGAADRGVIMSSQEATFLGLLAVEGVDLPGASVRG